MGLSETIRERDRDRLVGIGLVVAVMVAVAVAAQVLVPNTVVQGAPWAVGFGAVLLTYVGLRRFEPATIAEVSG